MKRVYLDNAATSWPKPPAVYEAVQSAMRDLGAAAGRSAYATAAEVERHLSETRRQIAELLGASDPRRVVFTFNATDSLNLAIHGTLSAGDHVVTSVLEHNSVLRPLRHAAGGNLELTHVECNPDGFVAPSDIESAIRPNTRMIALTQASNVTGAVQACEEVGEIARRRDLLFLVDAAQTAGHWPVDVHEMNCSLLALAGHKGLLGPLGVGLLYVAPGIEQRLRSVRQGGTGTVSESDQQPDSLPDKYESGNLNVPGILGLLAGVKFVREQGIAALHAQQQELTRQFLSGLQKISGIHITGRPGAPRVGVVSFSVDGFDPQEVAAMLDAAYRIEVRSGLHCAPLAHRSLGTFATGGTVRVSFGPFNSAADVELTLEALAGIAAG